METFENIYLDLSKQPGRCRIAESGLGWKPSGGGAFTLDSSHIGAAQWSRGARGHELKITSRVSGIVQLDGFQQEDFDRVSKCLKLFFGINLETREHALRGWNWGKAEFGKAELSFSVVNRPAFEIPYDEISNTNLAGKNEVAVELSLPGDGEETGTNGDLGGARAKGRKAGAARDQLTELRFYIPGVTVKKTKQDNADIESGEEREDEVEDGEEGEQQDAVTLFYETLLEKAAIGNVAGDTIATFVDILHLTPRGRFDLDMYEDSFRMRGKTYDYKVMYDHIKRIFLLPKPDDTHYLFAIALEPPLRQGQTKYPFIIMQFKREEDVELDLNMTEDTLKEKYESKLQLHYEEAQYSIVSKVFRGLGNKKMTIPSQNFKSHHQQSAVKCSIKASEGFLFILEKAFLFLPKPCQYIQYDQINVIVLSRMGGAVSASRTFDLTVQMKGGTENLFQNINREEQDTLLEFFSLKNIKVRNEMIDDSNTLIAQALKDEDMGSSDDDVVAAKADRGSADEDEESVDEDFRAESESDVAEEFDSEHESSGSGSDEEMNDAGSDDERPKKKSKKN